VNQASGGKNDRAAALAAAILRGVTMRPSGKWVSLKPSASLTPKVAFLKKCLLYYVASTTLFCGEVSIHRGFRYKGKGCSCI
jgi:hypothetical protein